MELSNFSKEELLTLQKDIVKELQIRENKEYDKAREKFFSALQELYSNYKYNMATSHQSWGDLKEDFDWIFPRESYEKSDEYDFFEDDEDFYNQDRNKA